MAFPNNVKILKKAVDPSSVEDVSKIKEYQSKLANGDFSGANKILAEMEKGISMNLNAGRYNEVMELIEQIQDFYINHVKQYLNDNIFKGSTLSVYSRANDYVVDNLVSDGVNWYICIKNNGISSKVVEPNVSIDWKEYWKSFLNQNNPKQYPIQKEQPTGQEIGDLWFQIIE